MGNVKPKKKLGQHFLSDHNIARKIAGALPDLKPSLCVEIGPGTGMLTQYLLERISPAPLIAIELDAESVTYLETHFMQKELTVLHQNFLKWDIAAEMSQSAHFSGNLPYNVSSPILFHLLDNLDYVDSTVFMVQKEVAQRICSGPGTKQYGILSVLLGYYFTLKYEFSVSEKVFIPPPKVKSGVFSMRKKNLEDPVPFPDLKKVVKAGFGMRRKTLRNAMRALSFQDFPEKEEWLSLRAEQMNIDMFVKFTRHLIPSE